MAHGGSTRLLMSEERANNSEGLQQNRDSEEEVDSATGSAGSKPPPPPPGGEGKEGAGETKGAMGCAASAHRGADNQLVHQPEGTRGADHVLASTDVEGRAEHAVEGGRGSNQPQKDEGKPSGTGSEPPIKSMDERLSELFRILAEPEGHVITREFFAAPTKDGVVPEVVEDQPEVEDQTGAAKRKKYLSDFLLEHGIGRNVDRFLDDLFNPNGGKDEQLELQEFTHRFKEELEISHKFVSPSLRISALPPRVCLAYNGLRLDSE